MHIPIKPYTKEQLLRMANPELAGQPEVLPWILYDTQDYTSGATTSIPFFQAVSADKTISNMESAGQLPEPQFFQVHYISVGFLFSGVSSDAAALGNMDDLYKLLHAGRGTFEMEISAKKYGPFPLVAFHDLGGPVGGVSQTVATVSQQWATNGVQDGGFPVGGQVIIPPKVGWNVNLRWAAAQATKQATIKIRVALVGALYRRVS